LASPDAARLIAALNAELTTTFPEPGATHFSLSDSQVVAGDGAFLVAYVDEPSQYTPELSRRARGVEIWAALRSLGREGLSE